MKLFIAVLLFSSAFIPADFHPIDDLISSELTDLTESSNEISDSPLEDKPYDGDLVMVAVENTGNLSEHVGFQVYLPDQADLLHFKSESSGPKGNPENEIKAKSSPLENADHDDEVSVYEMQTASTRSKLKRGNEIGYSFNYEVGSEESKQTNQFLAILDVFSDSPETLKIKFSSANFGAGKYPEGSKHRWLMRTRAGYSLSMDVKEVDLEKDLDTLTVYDVRSSGEKKVLSEVSVAKQLDTFSNRVLTVFKSDCSVNRGGFSAVVSIVKNKQKTCEAPDDLENGYFVVSDANERANVTYYCDENYAMIGDVTTLTCSGGSFEPSLLDSNIRCVPECTPPVLSGGSYAFKSRSNDPGDGSVVYNDVITYTCDVTHTMDASVTSADLVCGADGSMATLASQNIKCNEKCTVPSVDNSKTTVDGSAIVTEVAHGTRVDYTCGNGFVPTTTQSVTCGSVVPGQVDVSNITCNRRACSKPRRLTFGYYNEDLVDDYGEGQKVSFSCNENSVRLPPDGIIECGPDGWKFDHRCVEKFRFEVVKQEMKWEAARSYCQKKSGDLVQHDPRLLTRSGRKQIYEEMVNVPVNNHYHTGIRRDEKNGNVWRRSSDGVEVSVDGWFPGHPLDNGFLSWNLYDTDTSRNTIVNFPDWLRYFICEY